MPGNSCRKPSRSVHSFRVSFMGDAALETSKPEGAMRQIVLAKRVGAWHKPTRSGVPRACMLGLSASLLVPISIFTAAPSGRLQWSKDVNFCGTRNCVLKSIALLPLQAPIFRHWFVPRANLLPSIPLYGFRFLCTVKGSISARRNGIYRTH